jgi:hypothetical protein
VLRECTRTDVPLVVSYISALARNCIPLVVHDRRVHDDSAVDRGELVDRDVRHRRKARPTRKMGSNHYTIHLPVFSPRCISCSLLYILIQCVVPVIVNLHRYLPYANGLCGVGGGDSWFCDALRGSRSIV